jgi:hypothetical protein
MPELVDRVLVGVFGVDPRAGAEVMRRPRILTLWSCRLTRCMSMRPSRIVDGPMLESPQVEVAAELAVDALEIEFEGCGSACRVIGAHERGRILPEAVLLRLRLPFDPRMETMPSRHFLCQRQHAILRA